MAVRGSVILGNAGGFSGSSFIGSSAGLSQFWDGGRSAVLIQALAYASSPGLQLQLQSPSGSWLNVASSFLSDQLFVFDAVPGQYRLSNNGSSSLAVNAVILPVKYNS